MARVCPNCNMPVDEEGPFCVYCGAKLPEETGGIRKCGNGHEIDDPELSFCPICGLPLAHTEPAPVHVYTPPEPVYIPPEPVAPPVVPVVEVPSSWTCPVCGNVNSGDTKFCEGCGNPRGAIPEVRTPPVSPEPVVPYTPPEPVVRPPHVDTDASHYYERRDVIGATVEVINAQPGLGAPDTGALTKKRVGSRGHKDPASVISYAAPAPAAPVEVPPAEPPAAEPPAAEPPAAEPPADTTLEETLPSFE